MKKLLVFALTGAICQAAAFGQSLEEARRIVQKINAAYRNAPDMEARVEYRMFRSHTTEELLEKKEAVMQQHGKAYHLAFGAEMESFSDGKLDVMVHHEDRVLVVAPHSENVFNPFYGVGLDTLLGLCRQIQVRNYGPTSCLDLSLDFEEAEALAICFDEKTSLLRKMVVYFRTPQSLDDEDPEQPEATPTNAADRPRLEIHYLETDTAPKFSAADFELAHFILKKNVGYVPATRFSGFRLIDQTMPAK